MNLLIYKYNPDTIGLTKEIIEKFNIKIITSLHLKSKYEDMNVKDVIFINKNQFNFSFLFDIVQELDNREKIKNICMLSEEDIEIAGMLSDFYKLKKTPNMLSSFCYRDKYYMRTFLKSIVNEPDFRAINSKDELFKFFEEKNSPVIIKPRSSAGSEGVKIIRNLEKIEDLDISFENYLVEDFVKIKKMYTVDGISKDRKIVKFFIHEYDKPLAQTLDDNDSGFYIRTSKLYENCDEKSKQSTYGICEKNDIQNNLVIEKLFNYTKKAIYRLSNENSVHPFHFEYFLNENNEIIFCEAGARFGGGNLPYLIDLAYDTKISELYFELLFSNLDLKTIDDVKNIDKPSKIACCYMPYRRKGIVKKIPNIDKFDWTYNTRIIVKENQETFSPKSIVEQLFISVFTCKNESEFEISIKKLKDIALNDFVIE